MLAQKAKINSPRPNIIHRFVELLFLVLLLLLQVRLVFEADVGRV
jgi:hypothetical protein